MDYHEALDIHSWLIPENSWDSDLVINVYLSIYQEIFLQKCILFFSWWINDLITLLWHSPDSPYSMELLMNHTGAGRVT